MGASVAKGARSALVVECMESDNGVHIRITSCTNSDKEHRAKEYG